MKRTIAITGLAGALLAGLASVQAAKPSSRPAASIKRATTKPSKSASTKPASAVADVRGVPAIGHMLAIHIGADRIAALEKLFGRGLPCIGGHGESGRMWKEKATGWAIYVDTRDDEAGGRVVSYVVIGDPNQVVFPTETSSPKGKPKKPPVVPIRSRSMSLDHTLLPGMKRSEVTKLIAAKGWPVKTENAALVIRMGGASQVSKTVKFTDWEATLEFRGDRLAQIAVRAY